MLKYGKNKGAERPYIILGKNGKYIVIEGNTRIATYKLLTGLLKAPPGYEAKVPSISEKMKADLLTVDCTIAPDRETLFPIMTHAHFGLGDKSKWGYLGSRQAIYNEFKYGKSVDEISDMAGIGKSEVKNYIIEYELYLEAVKFKWSPKEKQKLQDPSLAFNPPIRFLQGKTHKEKMGIEYDLQNLKVIFADDLAKQKYKHLIYKLVINPQKGLGATAKYESVFKDFIPNTDSENIDDKTSGNNPNPNGSSNGGGNVGGQDNAKPPSDDNEADPPSPAQPTPQPKPVIKRGVLFSYQATKPVRLLRQLTREASQLDVRKFPAAGTFLLRNIIEALLKEIIHQNSANPQNEDLSLEKALNICMNKGVDLPNEDKKVLSQFKKNHLDYLNLGSHANIIPNSVMLFAARDCIDPFVRKYI